MKSFKSTIIFIYFFISLFLYFPPISPVFAADTYQYDWTKAVGGSGTDIDKSVSTDSLGNIYMTGWFTSTVDFDPGAGIDNHTSNGVAIADIFLTKYNSDGLYAWTKTVGGSGADIGYSVTTDSSGNIYLSGSYSTTVDFDPGAGTDNHTSNGGTDIFLTKFNSDGSYGWTKTIGGSSSDISTLITIDSSGNIYTAGYFSTTVDFDPGAGTDNHTSNGSTDIFLTKFNSDGSYGWTKTVGGSGTDIGYSVAIDSSGNIYLAGQFASTVDFDPGAGTDNQTASNNDAFLTKFNSDGSYGWTKIFGGTSSDGALSVKTDSLNNVYVSGFFQLTADFDPGAGTDNHTSNAAYDIFLTKFNSDGSYGWTKTMGGSSLASGSDYGYNIAIDGLDNIYLTGTYNTTVDFDPGSDVVNKTTSATSYDSFILSLTSSGNYRYVHVFSSNSSSVGNSITYDNYSNSIYVGGQFGSTTIDFDPQGAHDNKSTNGLSDIFLTKLSHVVVLPTSTPTPTPVEGSTGSGVSTTDTPQCGDTMPVNAPDLFQIDMKDNKAQLFFTPISNTDRFYISYSSGNTNAEENGVETTLFRDGVQSYTINLLNPNLTYYFKVRGQIGCMPGAWSNILKVHTNPKDNLSTTKYYEYGLSTISPQEQPKLSTNLSKGSEDPTPTTNLTEEAVVTQTPKLVVSTKPIPRPIPSSKFCILFWCWPR